MGEGYERGKALCVLCFFAANESVSICVNPWLKWRLRSVIIAARGVTISSNFLSGLLETDAIVLRLGGFAPWR